MKYTAASLEDIAEQFEARAVDCEFAATRTITVAAGANALSRAVAWRAAAEILRNTTLTGEA